MALKIILCVSVALNWLLTLAVTVQAERLRNYTALIDAINEEEEDTDEPV